jgi:ankyrin repeat protein
MKYFWLLGVSVLLAVSSAAQTAGARQSLIEAIQRGDTRAVARSLDSGARPTITDGEGVPALMLAVLFGDAAMVEVLVKHGADPNQADAAGATALMWAVPHLQKVRLLVERGANVNARSSALGRTPLLVAAGSPGATDVLALLLARGADLRARDAAGFNALAIAMQAADVEVVRFLVDRGLDPKEELPAAALRSVYTRHRPELVEYLMSRGLKILPDALTGPANWQSPELLQRWIAQGADVNARAGAYNVTPLMRAASSEAGSAGSVRVLLESGANPNAETTEGETALDWAVLRADRERVAALEKYGATRGKGPRRQELPPRPGTGMRDPRLSVERSVALLLKAAPPMFDERRCYTCHHNTVPAEAAALARRKGIAVPEDLARENLDDILAVLRPAAGPAMQGRQNVPGGVALTVGYGLMALAAEGRPADTITASHVHWTLATQMPDGSWLGNGQTRPPIEFSTVSHTVIGLRSLTLYPIPARKPEFDRALEKARSFLLTAEAPTAEERAMRLMGLIWTKAPEAAVKAASADIVGRQAASGGWSQLPQLDPDAYATGLSLVALHEARVPVTDAAYRRGVAYLLATQYPDGSWLVRSRSFPTQPYFESGFPFDRHQWISAAGTAWAAQAIALTLPDAKAR